MIGKVFFLVDMQKDSGFGHFIRCFTLADEFKKKNIDFSFVSQKISPEIKKYFKKKKFNKFYLEKFNNFNERGKIVIIDSYIINKKTINKIGKKNFLVIFNDFNLTKLNSNIEINNNLGAKSKKFSLSKLFGNKFCIIKKEIINNKKFITKKQKIKNIYITFGGYNKKNEIIKFFNNLKNINFFLKSKIQLFININILRNTLKNIFKKNKNITLNFIDLKLDNKFKFHNIDISINAGGVTSIEMIYLKIPQITMNLSLDQNRNSNFIKKNNLGMTLNKDVILKKHNLNNTMNKFINEYLVFKKNLLNKKYVDNMGSKRIYNQIVTSYKKNEKKFN